ncbi:MAG: hypothetical protein Q4C47_08375, partial [Planctomycetia bacterium]|nr:hypothetical protein [Planctomycetia bacterium]
PVLSVPVFRPLHSASGTERPTSDASGTYHVETPVRRVEDHESASRSEMEIGTGIEKSSGEDGW